MKTIYTKTWFFLLVLISILALFFFVLGESTYNFSRKYNDGELSESIDFIAENGTYNISHYIYDNDNKLIFNEKIYGIHFFLPNNRHLLIPLKSKVYQGDDTGASFDSAGGFMTVRIDQYNNSAILFMNERGVANFFDRMYVLSNLMLGMKFR